MVNRHLLHKPERRIATVYLITASLWILLSDSVLHFFGINESLIPGISIIKGLAFVVLTSAILYIHLCVEFAERSRLESALREQIQQGKTARIALEQSEQRFRKAVEQAPVPILIFAEDGEVLAVSQTWLDITGYSVEQLHTIASWTKLAYGENRHTVRVGIDRLFELDHRVDEGEFIIRCADRTQRIWNFSSTPLGYLQDNRRVVISIAADITEQKQLDMALKRTNQFLNTLIQAAPIGIVSFNSAGIVQLWNPSMESILGWTQDEVIGQPLPYIREQDRVEFARLRQRVASGETFTGVDVQRQRKDGVAIDLSISAGPLYDPAGVITGIVGVVKDISDRKRMEKELRESEQRFRLLINKAPQGIFVQTNHRFAYLNPHACHLFGSTPEDLLGQPVIERFHPDFHDQIRQRIHDLNQNRLAVPPIEEVFLRMDGTSFTVEVSAVPITFNEQDGALVFFHDITDRKRMENDLSESEQRFRQIAENIREVFYLNDAEKRQTLYISPAYETIWGRSCESLYQNPQSFLEAIHPDDRNKVLRTFDLQRKGQPIEITYRVVRPDQTMRWVRSRAFPVSNDEGMRYRIAGIAEDVTDQVQYQSQLRRLSQRLVNTLDDERARIARELHDQVGQQLTGLSINLAVIEQQSDAAISHLIDDATDLISSIIERIRLIIADLRPLALDDMGLGAGLRWYCEKFTRRTGIPVNLSLPQENLTFTPTIDNTFYQIAQEALTNIAKHAAASQVWITVAVEDNDLKMTINDNGKGFDIQTWLAGEQAGSWGLQIMRERIQALPGSHLHIDSQPGQGTTIQIGVPR